MIIYLASTTDVLKFQEDFRPPVPMSVLLSYRGKKDRHVQNLLHHKKFSDDIMVDSGAYGIQNNYAKDGRLPSVETFTNLAISYRDSIIEASNKGVKLSCFAELDIPTLVGWEQVTKWREEIFFPLQDKISTPLVFALADTYPEDVLSKFIEDPRIHYVAYPSFAKAAGEDKKIIYDEILSFYKSGIRVHGYGNISPDALKSYPYYSVDATSWAFSVGMVGAFLYFDQMTGSLKGVGLGKRVTKVRRYGNYAMLKSRGIMLPKDVLKIDGAIPKPLMKELLELQITQYKAMEKYYTSYWKKRGVDWEAQLEAFGETNG